MSAEKPTGSSPRGSGSEETHTASPALVAASEQPSKVKRGLFGSKPKAAEPETYAEKLADKSLDVNPEGKAKTDDIQPVSFFTMFRFATKFELFLNFIGLICAAATGAAMVSLSGIPFEHRQLTGAYSPSCPSSSATSPRTS
jgi:hypothetical protein